MSIRMLAMASNYAGTVNELPDCILDCTRVSTAFKKFCDVTLLIGKQESRLGVIAAVVKLLASLNKGDLGIIYYSGHGTYDSIKGKRESAIVCDDFQLIYDFEMHAELANRVPGSLLMCIADSCYSGGLLPRTLNHGKARTIAISRCVNHDVVRPTRSPEKPNADLTGCSAKEVSYSTGQGGALTNALLPALHARTDKTTLPALYKTIRKTLPSKQWPQTPGFYCDDVLAKRTINSFIAK